MWISRSRRRSRSYANAPETALRRKLPPRRELRHKSPFPEASLSSPHLLISSSPHFPSSRRRPAPILLEPAHHVELGPHPVRRQGLGPVPLALEPEHCGRDASHLERRVVLLRLRDR